MAQDAEDLGDQVTIGSDSKPVPDWVPAFKQSNIDGVLLVAGDSVPTIEKALDDALAIIDHTVVEVANLSGHVRPGKETGHEHFGFQDGISNPAVKGIDQDLSTEGPVDPGYVTT